MEIVADNIMGLDIYTMIILNKELSKNEAEIIEDTADAWCKIAFSGVFNGPLHNFTQPEYVKEKGCVVFHADIGSMNPVDSFELLKGACEGLNKNVFRDEVIHQIKLDNYFEDD